MSIKTTNTVNMKVRTNKNANKAASKNLKTKNTKLQRNSTNGDSKIESGDKTKAEDIETQNIFKALNLLNPQQLLSFKELVFPSDAKVSDETFLKFIKERFSRDFSGCPHCNSNTIIKFGKSKLGKQCYKCKVCSRIFCDSTASPLSYTKKSVLHWFNYLKCMCDNLSIRESALVVGIHRNTSFYWRHKILNAIKNKLKDNLEGIVEMSEIALCDNYKGNHSKNPFFSMGRPPRRSGRRPHEKIFENKVCILCCKDRSKDVLTQVAGRGRSKCDYLISLLKDKISKDSILCTNNNAAYIGFAKTLNLKLYKFTYNNEIKENIYHINNAKAFGTNFLKFLQGFNGVATKYLNFYLTWFKWIDETRNFLDYYKPMDLFLLLTSSSSTLRVRDFINVKSLPKEC